MKVNVNSSGIKEKNTFDLSSFHALTMDFGRSVPTQIIECVQGDDFDIDINSFFRMSPLVVPTFGNARFITRAFFVPNRVIEPAWENFIAESSDTSVTRTLLSFTNSDFVAYFCGLSADNIPAIGESNGLTTRVANDVSACDIALDYRPSGHLHVDAKFNFTDRGRWLYQVLKALGYSINWVYAVDANGDDRTPFDMLPLRAFARCFYDYIYPSAWVTQQGFGWLFTNPTLHSDVKSHLDAIANLMYCPYPQDHYTSAWQTINSVVRNSEVYTSLNILGQSVKDESGLRVEVTDDHTSVRQIDGTQTQTMSANMQRLLQTISDTITRYNIFGSRFTERVKSIFGFETKENRVSQSMFLKSFVTDTSIQDVTNMTASDSAMLGEQAGKGFTQGNGNLHFECSEYGYLIFITQLIPVTGYYQGRAHWTLARAPFEYYNGAYDNKFLAPIRNDELFADYQFKDARFADSIQYGLQPNGVFGFAPYYLHYKHGRDIVSGDFNLGSRNTGLESYHTLRILPQPSQQTPLVLDSSFLQIQPYDYDRIFSVDHRSLRFGIVVRVESYQTDLLCIYGTSTLATISYNGVEYIPHFNHQQDAVIFSPVDDLISKGYQSVNVGTITSWENGRNLTFYIGSHRFVLTMGVLDPSWDYLLSQDFGVASSDVQSYDHFIGYFYFDVKAHRNMLSFSDSIPMFDKSGRPTDTSYQGASV